MLQRIRALWLRLRGPWHPESRWDSQQAGGKWDYLGGLEELAHYSVLAGYALELKPGGDLLDIGCGEGLLRERLHPSAFGRYVGVDFGEAVRSAARRADDRTSFVIADMHDYVPDRSFDTIVFNEVLYYFRDPVAGARRY